MRSSRWISASPTRSFGSDDSNAVDVGATSTTCTSSLGTYSRRCGFPECQKAAKRGGLCISHGGGKKCSVEGCTTSVVSRGFCVAHGGGKRCQTPGCTKSAQTGGLCWIHGGGMKCGYQGCKKRAQSGGACISHGGGKRCRMDGCSKVVQYDGLCVGHGGYRKCLSLNCDKRALANSYCQAHGGNSMCRIAGCRKRAIRGGACIEHKAQIPHTTKMSAVLARCRPSIDLPETPFKVEPTEMGEPRQDEYRGYHTPLCTDSPGPAMYSRSSDLDILSLQYVRQVPSSLLDGRTMVTPISKHFNAGKSYNPYQRNNLPVLPSFQTLQRSCSSSPWSERSNMD
ncbi:hypothetical protein PI124_g13015 [Phytophthora idaei]|nr:hypothetical protein PI125_g13444 [Phytophthora idaei]KAG3160108.1 hypothetical protein PI126_g7072 [Phytophthora idaei]KAG3242153.1 hypothetical protein PI124_g13015 [Phytophthora idaei]